MARWTKAPAGFIVDLTDVEFLSVVGISVLVAAREAADAMSVRFGDSRRRGRYEQADPAARNWHCPGAVSTLADVCAIFVEGVAC